MISSGWRRIHHPELETDGGFTLIELLLVLVVMPVLVGAVVAVIIASLDSQSGLGTKLADSADSQITSTFYVRDVQSAAYMTTTSTPTSTPWTTPTTCGSGSTFVLGLEWPTSSNQDVVTYWKTQLSSATDGVSTAGSAAFSSASASITVGDVGQAIVETDSLGVIPFGTTVKGVNPTGHTVTLSSALATHQTGVSFVLAPQLVRSFCSGSATATTTAVSQDFFAPTTQAVITCASTTCTNSGYASMWAATTGVQGITLAIKEPSGQYNYALSAVPRVSSGSTGSTASGPNDGSAIPPFLMLGGGPVVSQSNGSITVDGNAAINGGYFDQSNGNFTVGSGYSIETTNSPASTACTQSGADCKDTPTSVFTTIGSPIADPLLGVADPTEGTSRGCPSSGNLSGTVTLQPGEYTCALTGATNSTVTLQPGVYELDGGLSMSSNSTLNGSGILLYLPCNTAGTGYGQDTWAPGCSGSLSLQSASVNVTPLTGTAAYAGLWYWQNGGDANAISIKGPSSTITFAGFMYAPGATVTLKSGTNGMMMGGIIANGVVMQQGTVTLTGG